VDLTPLLTHRFALDDITEAFDLFSNQRDGVLKVALHAFKPPVSMCELTGAGATVRER
jgi:hypothetical protein